MKLNIWNVFNFFYKYPQFTLEERRLELICVIYLFVILAALICTLLYKKIKREKK